jgi:quercetin dioxygenase-like cupin family protein
LTVSAGGGAIRGMIPFHALRAEFSKMRAVSRIAVLPAAVLAALATGYALGQQSAPTDYKLVAQDVLASIDLAKEIDSIQNRELRLSRAVISPGGHIGLHSHQGDPTIVYLLSGVLTNHHDDGTTEEFHPGQVFAEFGPCAHWVENKGTTPVTFIVANVGRRE